MAGYLRQAIYGTRPRYTYGEGPTNEPEGHFSQHKEILKIIYSSDDIRFTTKGEFIYATMLGWPEDKNEVLFTSFKDQDLIIGSVSLIRFEGRITWALEDNGLHVSLMGKRVNDMANVFKILIGK